MMMTDVKVQNISTLEYYDSYTMMMTNVKVQTFQH
jgi:hypothetical protein